MGNHGEPPAAAVKGTLSEDCGVSTAGTYVGRKGGDPLRWYLERFVWSIPEPGDTLCVPLGIARGRGNL